MDTLINDFERSMSYDSQHYASNDSGLSSNSNGGVFESDNKFTSFVDFHCDDLTNSLFINSIGNNELIRDDDIYSYKNKMEIQNIFNNKYRSFNFLKSDNFKIKNSCSFSSIIQDLENLKESEPLCKHPSKITMDNNITLKDRNANLNSILRPSEDHLIYMKHESIERNKVKKPIKKTKQQHNNSNNIQEYVSSSVKNYKGNQSLNELVQFIQGTPSHTKQNTGKSKSDKTVKADIVSVAEKSMPLSIVSDSGNSEQESPISKQSSITNSIIVDGDSGTQSNFVSVNNSDEDSQKGGCVNDFQEVLPKSRKKQKKPALSLADHTSSNGHPADRKSSPDSHARSATKSTVKCSKTTKKCSKTKTGSRTPDTVASSRSNIDLLDSKDSLQKFLSNQFSTFMKLSIMVS